jgi:hypothetical protein
MIPATTWSAQLQHCFHNNRSKYRKHILFAQQTKLFYWAQHKVLDKALSNRLHRDGCGTCHLVAPGNHQSPAASVFPTYRSDPPPSCRPIHGAAATAPSSNLASLLHPGPSFSWLRISLVWTRNLFWTSYTAQKNSTVKHKIEAPAAIHHNGSNELDLRPCRETRAHRPPMDKDRFMPRRPELAGDNDVQWSAPLPPASRHRRPAHPPP